MSYQILLCSEKLSVMGEYIQHFFNAQCVACTDDLKDLLTTGDYRAVVIDCSSLAYSLMTCTSSGLALGKQLDLPVIVIADQCSLADKLEAYQNGCDDIIDLATNKDEACARITKSIFHRIANEQLNNRLELATETARNAMVDNSDLGANIQFLLAVHECDNLDQLGQQLFVTLERYGLKCSLQMRSSLGVKNMEAHGMSKDLESQLLYQLKNTDRYIDFGARTICNYDRVSLLIKNMPVDDADKYGAIKDNTFHLLQGLNARIHSLEDRHTLIEERECLRKLSKDINTVMNCVKARYQDVMQSIMNEVDLSTSMLQDRVPHLALIESDEAFIDGVVERLIGTTNNVFSEGLKVDEIFMRLEMSLETSLHALDEHPELAGASKSPRPPSSSVDLF
ncbi:DNA-binding response regulator [Marinagarivorans algicola]|uniref:DNA-binding response regulator n=1 Tax=Marinagarivorans algicola TaxID=1513270 RepID=UPI000AD709AF|nr:DNA-binding response regulator [Marinagarivorans algicola]